MTQNLDRDVLRPGLPPVEEIFDMFSRKYSENEVEKALARDQNIEMFQSLLKRFSDLKIQIMEVPSRSLMARSVYELIDEIQMLRHDVLHIMLAAELDLPAGEKRVGEMMRRFFKTLIEFQDKDLDKTPDIMFVDDKTQTVWMIDVAISVSSKVVSGFKEEKYKPVADKCERWMNESGIPYKCRFFPWVLDQGLSNIMMELEPLNKRLSYSKQVTVSILVAECGQMISDLKYQKLVNSDVERKLLTELLERRSGTDKGTIVYPIPNDESVKRLLQADNPYVTEASKEYSFPTDSSYPHATYIAEEFMRSTNTKERIMQSQIFHPNSPNTISKIFQKMEKVAADEFKPISDPKPSLHFMMALTGHEIVSHDGNLDARRVQDLKVAIEKGMFTVGRSTKDTTEMYTLLNSIMEYVPSMSDGAETRNKQIWLGIEKPENGKSEDCQGKSTVNKACLKEHKSFLEEWAGLGKEEEPCLDQVKSLQFWNESVRNDAESEIMTEGIKLVMPKRKYTLNQTMSLGIPSLKKAEDHMTEEVRPIFEMIASTQASYMSKQISEMCMSMLVQRKREANHVQILSKGDRGFYIVTLPHRMLDAKKTGNSVPFLNICLHKENEEIINKEILFCQFKTTGGMYVSVSRAMRLDVHRLESLSHSYELFNSVTTGWMMSQDEPFKNDDDFRKQYVAFSYLFYLCHSVHIRTGGLLDNLRYMFMDVTAEKSNFEMFMLDNGKIALKNTIQVALYSRMRKTLPLYAMASASMKKREAEFDADEGTVVWGSLGVSDVKIPSLISPDICFESFMSATNEIVGLFFAIPKDLHGEFHKKVSLESTPFEWQVKYDNFKDHYLDKAGVKKAIEDGSASLQNVDVNLAFEIGCFVNDQYLMPKENEFRKELGKLRLLDSILNHKQFTSGHSCIHSVDDEGYINRNKVLMCTLDLIDEHFKGDPPSLWQFCEWALSSEEPFRFVISPKGQRTMNDREIYIGNLQSFSLRVVEKIFSVVCKFMPNEAIHIAGDNKFMTIQNSFRRMLNWSREITRLHVEKQKLHTKVIEINTHRNNILEREKRKNPEMKNVTAAQHRIGLLTEEEVALINRLSGIKIQDESIVKHTRKQANEILKEESIIKRYNDLKDLPNYKANIVFLNGDRTKWSAADVNSKFLYFIDGLTIIPSHIRVMMKAILIKHDNKYMHLSKDLHQKMLTMDSMENHPIRKICGVESCGVIKGNWFQGMLNYISSAFHAGMQELSWEFLRTKILKNIPTEFQGLCHSDDEVAFLGFATPDLTSEEMQSNYNDFCKYPLETILSFHNLFGSLSCMNYSKKKTNVHLKVAEFVSLYLIWGDQQFPFIKHLSTAISGLPGTGLDDDIYAALAQIMSAAARGCPLSALIPVIKMTHDRIDRMYSTGSGMENDVANIFGLPREYLPLELGGHFAAGPLALLIGGPAVHDIMLLRQALEDKLPMESWNQKVLKLFYALSPHGLVKLVADDDALAQEQAYSTSRLSGFTGMMFKNYMPKFNDKIWEKVTSKIEDFDEIGFMIKNPSASIIKPSVGKESMMYWRLIASKPAWVRAMRKDGARGMAIKRAQWVRGEQVKLRHSDEWRTLKSCLVEIANYSDKKGAYLGDYERSILFNYVHNVSSSTVSIMNYFLNCSIRLRKEKKPSDVRLAHVLERPVAFRDVKNDVRKVITYAWDIKSYKKEHLSVKFPSILEDDVAKVKAFHEPVHLKPTKDPSLIKLQNAFAEAQYLMNIGFTSEQTVQEVYRNHFSTEKNAEQFTNFVKDVYAEISWVYKQFEERERRRVVITSAVYKGSSTIHKIICENCLRWSSFYATTSNLVKTQPTAALPGNERDAMELRVIVDTIAYTYRKLIGLGLSFSKIHSIFGKLCIEKYDRIKRTSEMWTFHKWVTYAVQMLLIKHDTEIQAKKLMAVIQLCVYKKRDLAASLMDNFKTPLGIWEVEQKHVGGGKYEGNFKWVCWVGKYRLYVTSESEIQKWYIYCDDSAIAYQMVKRSYYEIFKENHHDLRLLNPTTATQTMAGKYLCRIGNTWTIARPTVGVTFIPKIQFMSRPSYLSDHEERNIYYGSHNSGLEIYQKVADVGVKPLKVLSIKYTNLRMRAVEKIKVAGPVDVIPVDNVDLAVIIRENQLLNLFEGNGDLIPLDIIIRALIVKDVNTTSIYEFWQYISMRSKAELIPPCPLDINLKDFPKLPKREVEKKADRPTFMTTDQLLASLAEEDAELEARKAKASEAKSKKLDWSVELEGEDEEEDEDEEFDIAAMMAKEAEEEEAETKGDIKNDIEDPRLAVPKISSNFGELHNAVQFKFVETKTEDGRTYADLITDMLEVKPIERAPKVEFLMEDPRSRGSEVLFNPELYRLELRKCKRIELYGDFMPVDTPDDDYEPEHRAESYSSGSTGLSIREKFRQFPGKTLDEKLVSKCLCLDENIGPNIFEMIMYFSHKTPRIGEKVSFIRDNLFKSRLFVWSKFCEHVLTFGTEIPLDQLAKAPKEEILRLMEPITQHVQMTGSPFREYKHYLVESLYNNSYVVESPVASTSDLFSW